MMILDKFLKYWRGAKEVPLPESHVYASIDARNKLFRYRGKVGPGDDLEAYIRIMARSNIPVIVTTRYKGKLINEVENMIEG